MSAEAPRQPTGPTMPRNGSLAALSDRYNRVAEADKLHDPQTLTLLEERVLLDLRYAAKYDGEQPVAIYYKYSRLSVERGVERMSVGHPRSKPDLYATKNVYRLRVFEFGDTYVVAVHSPAPMSDEAADALLEQTLYPKLEYLALGNAESDFHEYCRKMVEFIQNFSCNHSLGRFDLFRNDSERLRQKLLAAFDVRFPAEFGPIGGMHVLPESLRCKTLKQIADEREKPAAAAVEQKDEKA